MNPSEVFRDDANLLSTELGSHVRLRYPALNTLFFFD